MLDLTFIAVNLFGVAGGLLIGWLALARKWTFIQAAALVLAMWSIAMGVKYS